MRLRRTIPNPLSGAEWRGLKQRVHRGCSKALWPFHCQKRQSPQKQEDQQGCAEPATRAAFDQNVSHDLVSPFFFPQRACRHRLLLSNRAAWGESEADRNVRGETQFPIAEPTSGWCESLPHVQDTAAAELTQIGFAPEPLANSNASSSAFRSVSCVFSTQRPAAVVL